MMRRITLAGLVGYGAGLGIAVLAFLKEPPLTTPDLARYQEISQLLDGTASQGLEQKAERIGFSLRVWKKLLQAQQDSLQRRYGFLRDKLDYEAMLSRHYTAQAYLFLSGVGVLTASFFVIEYGLREDPRIYRASPAAAERQWLIFPGHRS